MTDREPPALRHIAKAYRGVVKDALAQGWRLEWARTKGPLTRIVSPDGSVIVSTGSGGGHTGGPSVGHDIAKIRRALR